MRQCVLRHGHRGPHDDGEQEFFGGREIPADPSRALLERAAVAVLPMLVDHYDAEHAARRAVKYARALVAEMDGKGDTE